MESEATPKRSKPTNAAHFTSISSKDSALPMPNLPAEIITDILLMLAVKSLLQFMSVSKSWLSLISSPEFVKNHILLSVSNKYYTHHGVMIKDSNPNSDVKDCSLSALLYDSVTEAFNLDYPGKIPDAYPRLVGFVNGLICLAINPFYGLDYLFIWNPSIRKYKKLPSYGLNLNRLYQEDALAPLNFGFAYDEFQDDYKVVCIFPIYRYVSRCRVEVKIYSLKSDSWRCIGDFQGRELLDDFAKSVNGKLHWLDKQWNIISIDLADDEWVEVEQLCSFKRCAFLKLRVFESYLSVFRNYTWTHVDVWVMKDSEGVWGIRILEKDVYHQVS